MMACQITKRSAWLALLFSALLLSSCVVLDSPLSDPEKAKPDARLFGAWKSLESPSDVIFIGKSDLSGGPSGIMKFLEISFDKANKIIVKGPLYFSTTSVGNSTYANFYAGKSDLTLTSWDKRDGNKCLLRKYKVEGDKLQVWGIDEKAAKAAIQKGQVKGTIGKEEEVWSLVTFTDAQDLTRFLADGGDKELFPDCRNLLLRRIK